MSLPEADVARVRRWLAKQNEQIGEHIEELRVEMDVDAQAITRKKNSTGPSPISRNRASGTSAAGEAGSCLHDHLVQPRGDVFERR